MTDKAVAWRVTWKTRTATTTQVFENEGNAHFWAHTRDGATVEPLYTHPRNEWIRYAQKLEAVIAALEENTKLDRMLDSKASCALLVEAASGLELAANRLQRCAVDHIPSNREFHERKEWADEARELVTKLKGASCTN